MPIPNCSAQPTASTCDAGAGEPLGPLLTGELRLRKAADVLAILEGQVTVVLEDERLTTAERARLIASLSGVALRAIEASDLAARLEAVEQALARREGSTRS
jgi:hypothetical protein